MQQMVDQVLELPEGTRFSVLAPMVRDRKGEFTKELGQAAPGRASCAPTSTASCTSWPSRPSSTRTRRTPSRCSSIAWCSKDGIRQRLTDSIELAAKLAERHRQDLAARGRRPAVLREVRLHDLRHLLPGDHAAPVLVQQPGRRLPGLRRHRRQDVLRPRPDRPRRGAVAAEGAIEPWEQRNAPFFHQILDAVAAHFKIDLYVPWGKLPAKTRDAHPGGLGRRGGRVRLREERRASTPSRRSSRACSPTWSGASTSTSGGGASRGAPPTRTSRRSTTSSTATCPRPSCEECEGTRLRKEARFVKVGGKSITEMTALTIREAHDFLHELQAVAARRRRSPSASCARSATGCRSSINVGARLPDARPHGGDAVGRRGAAHPAGDADRQLAGRRALHPRRAVDRPAPARQRAPARRR